LANQFRHGFKAEAERIALELRGELYIGAHGRLDPAALAEHLCIPVLTLHELRTAAPDAVRHFAGRARSVFSAVTISIDRYRRAIVTNPFHAPTRQMSSVCHEVSHIVLEHQAETPLNISGGRSWNGTQEREADWLAGCLLIPQGATHAAARAGKSDDQVAIRFGVSLALASWRMNATGARIRAARLANLL
jgi:IrrE N-terminal-like domain